MPSIKIHWMLAAPMVASLPLLAAAQTVNLSVEEQIIRAAYQEYLTCADTQLKSENDKPVWQMQDECLAEAARNAGFKKSHDVLTKASDVIRQHGFVAVMTDEERPAFLLLKTHLNCIKERSRVLGGRIDEETDSSCARDHGIREQDRVLWPRILAKYGPDSVR